MKDSDYFLLTANMFLAAHLSKGWSWLMWAINFAGFCLFFYLERT
jgi:hypothetical protein